MTPTKMYLNFGDKLVAIEVLPNTEEMRALCNINDCAISLHTISDVCGVKTEFPYREYKKDPWAGEKCGTTCVRTLEHYALQIAWLFSDQQLNNNETLGREM